MKRRCIWTAAILLASGGMAFGSDLLPPLLSAETELEEMAEGDLYPSVEPVVEEALPDEAELSLEAAPATAARPVSSSLSWESGAAPGCGASLQCCERVPHHLDNIWDGYCMEKSHHHPASSVFGSLHIKHHRHACPPPTCDEGCGCHFGLPKLPSLPRLRGHCAAGACETCDTCDNCNTCDQCDTCDECDTCDKCNTYSRPRRSLFGHLRKPACHECGCSSHPLESPVMDTYSAPVDDPALAPPAPVTPPMSELPPAAGVQPDAQGWLPMPWLQRLPL